MARITIGGKVPGRGISGHEFVVRQGGEDPAPKKQAPS
jgi:hypothetical protein